MEKKKRQVVDHHVETFSFPFLTATSTMQSCGVVCLIWIWIFKILQLISTFIF